MHSQDNNKPNRTKIFNQNFKVQSIALTIGFFLYIGFEFDTHEQIENEVPSQQKLGKHIYSEKHPHYLENNIKSMYYVSRSEKQGTPAEEFESCTSGSQT